MSVPKTNRNYVRLGSFFCLIIVCLVSAGWFFRQRVNLPDIKGTAELSPEQRDAISDQQEYLSLDLRVARNAVYKGAPLKIVKNLGIFGGVQQQIFSFPVYGANLTEYGLLTLPLTPQPAGGYPVVVLCHGYVDPKFYRTTKAYLPQMEYYSQHGFAVVKPDFRGQGLSIKAGKPEGAYYSMAYNTDLLSLLASVKKTSYLDKDKLNLWGHSMGAYIALRAAVLSSDIRNVILLSGPVGTVQDMYTMYTPASDRNNPVALLIKHTAISEHGTPLSNPTFWDNTSPLNFLKNTSANIQIHVGTNDRIVPPKFSADLDSALSKIRKAHSYYVYQGGSHGLGVEMPQVLARSLSQMQSD